MFHTNLQISPFVSEEVFHKTTFNEFLFVYIGLLALLFSFVTVAFHSLKTPRTNPVESLKNE